MFRKGHNIEPLFVRKPVDFFGNFVLDIQGGTSLQENSNIGLGNYLSCGLDFEANHKLVHSLVFYEKPSVNVFKDMESQFFNDIFDSFLGNLVFFGVINTFVEKL